jgi:2-polyprenyl-6-methoxyphenol hydroxylase-like FAD-dependent oxidoreductase
MVLVGLAIVVAACRSAGSADIATAAIPGPACRATVQGVDVTAWREIAAEGFRFCVPPAWRGSGQTLRHGGASLTWGLGEHPQRQAVATAVVTVPASELGTVTNGAVPNSDVRRFTEDIGGRQADVWRNRFGNKYYTGAPWSSPRVWLIGDAEDAPSANLQVTIFRTVRFDTN